MNAGREVRRNILAMIEFKPSSDFLRFGSANKGLLLRPRLGR